MQSRSIELSFFEFAIIAHDSFHNSSACTVLHAQSCSQSCCGPSLNHHLIHDHTYAKIESICVQIYRVNGYSLS